MKGKFQHFLGIDVSKLKVDVCAIIDAEHCVLHEQAFDQSRTGFKLMDQWIKKISSAGNNPQEVLICVENTGLYDDALIKFLFEKGYSVCLENAMMIKSSIRDKR